MLKVPFSSASAGIENPSAEITPARSGFSRRESLAGFLALYASAALANVGCRRERAAPDTSTSRMPLPTLPENEISVFPDTIEIDPSIPMPTSEIIDTPYEFPVPADLEESMDPAEFAEKARIAAAAMAQYVEETLIPELKSAAEPGPESNEVILRAIGDFPALLVNTVPEFRTAFEAFRRRAAEQGNKQSIWVNYLKPFLEAGGYFFEVKEEGDRLQLSFSPLLGTQHVRISDGTSSYNVPLIRLGKDKIEPTFSSRRRGTTATMSEGFRQIYLFEDEIEPVFRNALTIGKPDWPRFSNPFKSEEEFQRNKELFRRDGIHHEAAHAFLARQFPTIASITARDRFFKIETQIEFVRGGKETGPRQYNFNLSGEFPPAMIQELAGVGAHLAISPIEGPWEHYGLFATGGARTSTYHLASIILAVATMWMAPKSPMHDLDSSNGRYVVISLTQDDVGQVIGNEPYSQADTKAVGEAMYRIAYDLFRRLSTRT